MIRPRAFLFLLALFAVCAAWSSHPLLAAVQNLEVVYSNEAFAKLDSFEGNVLNKCDKVFNTKQWRQATAEYTSFTTEFPKSAALPYALYRRARCLQLDGKRFEAIRQYQEVLDYFPNLVEYAAPAQYQIGACLQENGDVEKAMVAWAKMADDADYSKHPLAAGAVNALAGHLMAKKDVAHSLDYYRQVALDFRTSNKAASEAARNAVIGFYIRTRPEQAKLREFYEKVSGFDDTPIQVGKEPEKDWRYWEWVRHWIRHYGSFPDDQAAARTAYYKYWVEQLLGKFIGQDDYAIDLIGFQLQAEGDRKKWTERLDKHFADYQKEGNYPRVVRWIEIFSADKAKVDEYFAKLSWDKMEIGTIIRMYFVAQDRVGNRDMARATFSKIPISKMTDAEKDSQLYQHLIHRDEQLVIDLCMQYQNKTYGQLQLMRYHHGKGNNAKGIEIANALVNVPDYAKEVYYKKGEMHQRSGQFDAAIGAYRAADNPPDNVFRIAECLRASNKLEQALGQLREIEGFFKNRAPEAALIAALWLRDAGLKDRYVAELRGILKKYPESGQSSTAHLELERMGLRKIGGGTDAQ